MPSIVLLTGVIGAGKSTVADKFRSSAFIVRTDALQFDATRRAFPFIRPAQEQNWEAWPQDTTTMYMDRLFSLSLHATHPELSSHQGNIIVEGTIVCREWFHVPLVQEIKKVGQSLANASIHYLDLIPTEVALQKQILARGRPDDVAQFSDIETVRQHIEWAQERTAVGWRRFDDASDMESAIRTIFKSNQD